MVKAHQMSWWQTVVIVAVAGARTWKHDQLLADTSCFLTWRLVRRRHQEISREC